MSLLNPLKILEICASVQGSSVLELRVYEEAFKVQIIAGLPSGEVKSHRLRFERAREIGLDNYVRPIIEGWVRRAQST